MAYDFGSHKSDSSNVGVTILFAESQSFRQVRSHDVTVQKGDLSAIFHQLGSEEFGGSGLPGPAETGEPDADTLTVAES